MTRFLFCFVLAATPALAQFSSAIQGTVTDPSHSGVPDAKVTVKNEATGIARSTTTTADGYYRVSSLGPGTYTVTVQKSEFNTKEETSVPLANSEVGRIDVSLTVGTVNERIDVTGDVVLVETGQGRVSGRIDTTQLKELPINGRNILNLIAIQPGIVGRGLSSGLYSGGGSDSFSGETQPSVFASGQRFEGHKYTFDDSRANGAARKGVLTGGPDPAAVEVGRVGANNFSP